MPGAETAVSRVRVGVLLPSREAMLSGRSEAYYGLPYDVMAAHGVTAVRCMLCATHEPRRGGGAR